MLLTDEILTEEGLDEVETLVLQRDALEAALKMGASLVQDLVRGDVAVRCALVRARNVAAEVDDVLCSRPDVLSVVSRVLAGQTGPVPSWASVARRLDEDIRSSDLSGWLAATPPGETRLVSAVALFQPVLLFLQQSRHRQGVAADAGMDPRLGSLRTALAATPCFVEGDEGTSVHLDVVDTPSGAQLRVWISGSGARRRYARAVVGLPGALSCAGTLWQGLAFVSLPERGNLSGLIGSGFEVYLEEAAGKRRRILMEEAKE